MSISSTSTTPVTLSLPSSTPNTPINVSVALCSEEQPVPTFTVTSISNASATRLTLDEGIGVWTGFTGTGDTLVISLGDGASSIQGGVWSFELAVSNGAPLHRSLSTLPLLGDTTATQALLFSPPFAPPIPIHTSSSYPNYTLPGGISRFQILLLLRCNQIHRSSLLRPLNYYNRSWLGTNGTGGVNCSTDLALRDAEGWRSQWIVEGLTANTNYSAWVIQDGGALAGPIYAFTKSSSFNCPLVHSLPFCPLTSYAVPLPPTPDGATSYSSSNVPSNISDPLISSISNFTVALLTFPCGRELYSPIQTCDSCADAYRAWACAVSFPRCGEIPSTLASSLASQPTAPKKSESQKALPTPAILPSSPASRLQTNSSYNELLPCIETCQSVDRACPPLFSWTCPLPSVNANWSYGVGFIDSSDGLQGKGVPGVAQDRWGIAWCNG
ncbi:stretch-activated cation channel Mid1 [Gautieria morchelliformis]|nr:stretch-activated cation channel Mid1 [Gautieria morchelliformis]